MKKKLFFAEENSWKTFEARRTRLFLNIFFSNPYNCLSACSNDDVRLFFVLHTLFIHFRVSSQVALRAVIKIDTSPAFSSLWMRYYAWHFSGIPMAKFKGDFFILFYLYMEDKLNEKWGMEHLKGTAFCVENKLQQRL